MSLYASLVWSLWVYLQYALGLPLLSHRQAVLGFRWFFRGLNQCGNIITDKDVHKLLVDWEAARQVTRPGNTLEDEQDEIDIRNCLKPDSSSSASPAGHFVTTLTSRSSSSKPPRFDDGYRFPALTPLCRRRLCHSGTWQFISGRLLKNAAKNHKRADDLESCLYVLVYVIFRYQESSLNEDFLALEMEEIFNQSDIVEGVHCGGRGKGSFLRGSGWTLPPKIVTESFPVALAGIINSLRSIFVKRYTSRPEPLDTVHAVYRKDVQVQWDRYNKDKKRARAALSTSNEVIAIFKTFLDMPDSDWEEGRPYMDRLEWQWISEETMQNERKREQLQATPMGNKKRATGAGIHSG